jgi:hypothetical protein
MFWRFKVPWRVHSKKFEKSKVVFFGKPDKNEHEKVLLV